MSFLFLLFFLSSKSLIYKITQKINVLPYKIIRIKRTHQYRKNTVKGICKAKAIVATKQIREIIILNIKNILLFFIVHQLAHFPNTLACIWNIYVRSAHIAVDLRALYQKDSLMSGCEVLPLRIWGTLVFFFFHYLPRIKFLLHLF